MKKEKLETTAIEQLEKEGLSFIKILVISKIIIIALVGALSWWLLKDI